jgi:formate dehydrogenase subunit beta
MQRIAEMIKEKAAQLLREGKVARVLGWEAGELAYDLTPAYFETEEELKNLVYNEFSGANLSKYLIAASKMEGVTLALLKPCDTLSFNQLLNEHRISREKVYVLGVGCKGMKDKDGELLLKCKCCKGKEFKAFDEIIDDEECRIVPESDRFEEVRRIEAMSADERFAFWRGELSKCIRCNACRNVCPACSCVKCVFDNPKSGVAAKANTDDFEENMFHIIRAFHVAGRCTDCGECSRVCPQGIPLHLLNRKFIKDINELYGEYQAGDDPEARGPLTNYTQGDAEPSVVQERSGE